MTKKTKEQKNYNKAPIIEALIDIKTKLPEGSKLSDLAKELKKDFPNQEPINVGMAEIHLNMTKNKSSLSTSSENIGIKLSSDNSPYVLQLKNNGFTFSILKEYNNWDDFSKKAKSFWNKYNKMFKPERVSRVAVRYINRIDIPSLKFDLEDYFETYPRVLKDNKGSLASFFLQAQIPQEEYGGMAVINQTVTEPSSPGYTSVILDIDVFDPKGFAPSSKELWERVGVLRKQKNDIFESSITKKTRELFV